MFACQEDVCSVVSSSLAGERPIDEETFSSAAALFERLEGLKKRSGLFKEVALSPYVVRLLSKQTIATSGES